MGLRIEKVKAKTKGAVAKKADKMSRKLEKKGYYVIDVEFERPRFGYFNNHAFIKYRKAEDKEENG